MPRRAGIHAADHDRRADALTELVGAGVPIQLSGMGSVGVSLGAIIAVELFLRHAGLVRRVSLLDSGQIESAIANRLEKMAVPADVRAAMASGRHEDGLEALLRDLGAWDAMDPESRQRVLGNADALFTHKTPFAPNVRPGKAALTANRVPVQVGVGKDTRPVLREMADWLASQLGVCAQTYPGGNAAALNHPLQVAEVILPLLQKAQVTSRRAQRHSGLGWRCAFARRHAPHDFDHETGCFLVRQARVRERQPAPIIERVLHGEQQFRLSGFTNVPAIGKDLICAVTQLPHCQSYGCKRVIRFDQVEQMVQHPAIPPVPGVLL